MISKSTYEFLDVLAEQYIPEGKHELLHIDSRKAWITLMTNLVEGGYVEKRLNSFKKCAINWEALLAQKYSIQN
jgi:hypothetical protein